MALGTIRIPMITEIPNLVKILGENLACYQSRPEESYERPVDDEPDEQANGRAGGRGGPAFYRRCAAHSVTMGFQ